VGIPRCITAATALVIEETLVESWVWTLEALA
jgi:hypothetical protein